jgi:hypothetical protein
MRVAEFMISLPTDLVNHDNKSDEEIIEEFGGYAIDQAREEATDYVMPANWTATLVEGDIHEGNEVTFKVVRTSN